MKEIIKQKFHDHIQMQIASVDLLVEPLEQATELIVATLLKGGKIISCAEPASEFLSSYFVNALLSQFETERPGFPAIALTGQPGFFVDDAMRYSHKLKALAQAMDCLVLIVNRGDCENIIQTFQTANAMDLRVIAFLSEDAMGYCAGLLSNDDVIIQIPSNTLSHLHESYLLVIHCLLQLIDNTLFMQYEG